MKNDDTTSRPILDIRMILQGMLGEPLLVDGEVVEPDALALVILKFGDELEQQDIEDPDLKEDEGDLVEFHTVVIEHLLDPMYDEDYSECESSVASLALGAIESHISVLEAVRDISDKLSLNDLLEEDDDEGEEN